MKLTIFALAIVFSQAALSDDRSKREAEALLRTMNMDTLLEQSIGRMLEVQLQQNPALAPYRQVMLEFFARHMSYASLKPEIIEIYASAFTAEELADINAFYGTSTGRKTLRVMPELMSKAAQVGATRVQDNIGELQGMIQAESKRIQELQAR